MKSHWGLCHIQTNNFGLIYDISKDIATAKTRENDDVIQVNLSQITLTAHRKFVTNK